ncbi:adenosylcobinamide-GDP ribazoletransferase [Peribacillus loiseleuriae]|uniref:Adenosylcobinamide-GDP ribazoletransferase n=1 Tax=Peribacillus loiseleuriae TaxID=1679170 RepID=A0A0K9GZK0_9BACI|nr:adenosylcobinamide-GDP ribazoletransferase [Peribacillus loiseleuriae]KMY52031.1 cobalamin biosynthesis protein CobS [Peribacillus loiseleuriae]
MSVLIGYLINLQFFTAIPVKKQLPMDEPFIRRAVQTFPLAGLTLGLLVSGSLYVLIEWTPLSLLVISFVVWLLTIILTGGLHLDGWMDASDAFFSYQDKEKRLEIMSDPRTGAFGVLSVIVLLSARFLFIYEIISRMNLDFYFLIILIPTLSKMVMGVLLYTIPLAKQDGLAAFFQRAAKKSSIQVYGLYLIGVLLMAFYISIPLLYMSLVMIIVACIFFLLIRRKSVIWFGGITGDVLGASVEGVELILWLTVWALPYFAMV